MNFRKAAEHLDGLAVANVNEPSEGDLERVLKNQSKLKTRLTELEGELSDTRQLYYQVISQRNAFYDRVKQLEGMLQELVKAIGHVNPISAHVESAYNKARVALDGEKK